MIYDDSRDGIWRGGERRAAIELHSSMRKQIDMSERGAVNKQPTISLRYGLANSNFGWTSAQGKINLQLKWLPVIAGMRLMISRLSVQDSLFERDSLTALEEPLIAGPTLNSIVFLAAVNAAGVRYQSISSL